MIVDPKRPRNNPGDTKNNSGDSLTKFSEKDYWFQNRMISAQNTQKRIAVGICKEMRDNA